MGEELFKSKILDDMFAELNASFQGEFQQKYGKNKYSKRAEKIIAKIKKILTENGVNSEIANEIYFLIEDVQECESNERFYWFKQWYKKGFVDAKKIQIETEEIKIVPPDENEENVDNLFDGDTEYSEDDDTIEIKEETPEWEDYYNKLGVKPRIFPSIKFGEEIKLNRKSPVSKDKPLKVQLNGNNTINMTTNSDSVIPDLNDQKNTNQ